MSEAQQRIAWRSFDGNEAEMVSIDFGPKRLKVARPTVDAWSALEAILEAHGYQIRGDDTHGFSVRNVKGTGVRSLHAFGIALDINATTNPIRETPNRRKVRFSGAGTQAERAHDVVHLHADTDMTPAMVEDVRSVRTRGSRQLFGWGGDWVTRKDPMHFYIDVPPDELARGVDWSSVRGRARVDAGARSEEGWMAGRIVEAWDTTEGADMANAAVERFRPMLDFISVHEGTAGRPGGGYNTSLGYGRFTNGEQDLVSMTLDQIDALQTRMLNHPSNTYNSSALGRYQIVRKTLRGLRTELGLLGTQLFSPSLQDLCGVTLIKRRGRSVPGLRMEWASLKDASEREILAAYDSRGASGPEPDAPEPADRTSEAALMDLLRRALAGRIDIDRPAAQTALGPGDRGPAVEALQRALSAQNYQVGKIDGIYGSFTTAAVSAFQTDYRIQAASLGSVDARTWEALAKTPGRPLSPERRNTTADDLRRDGSVIVKNADRTRQLGWLSGILGVLGLGNSAYNNMPATSGSKDIAKAILQNRDFIGRIVDAPQADKLRTVAEEILKIGTANPTATDVVTNAIGTALPIVLNSVLPGFGGSLAVIGLGIASELFGKRIINRRVENQRDGSNISPLGPPR